MGFSRNLAVHEIAGQVREVTLLTGRAPTNIVFMGMGEPLMNWKAVDPTLTILNDANGFGIGARHITVSTVGVLPGIVALGERPEQFRLAISIHAPTDALRRSLMPINTKYPLAQVIETLAREGRCRTATLEHWVPPEPAFADTLLKEEAWCVRSTAQMRRWFPASFAPSVP